jgi:hypothetical protein
VTRPTGRVKRSFRRRNPDTYRRRLWASIQFYSYFASTYFLRTSSIRTFSFLRVLIDSASCIASSATFGDLEFRVSTSWLWLPGVSLLSGPKCSNYYPCRLIGQIDWHVLDTGLSISPLCLQIYFCINTSFCMPGRTKSTSSTCSILRSTQTMSPR